MKTFNKLIVAFFLFSVFVSCGEDLPWENEQYEKMIYILCDNSSKVFDAEYHFDGSINEQKVSLLCSGTHNIDEDIEITLGKDTVLLDRYNKNNFDIDEESYAKVLSPDRYNMPTNKAILKAGESKALLSIFVDKEDLVGLSPDSIYFIPLAIEKVSGYTINPDNYNMLFRVYARNAYASTLTLTNYRLKGYQGEGAVSLNEKTFHPLSVDEVRCFAGVIAYDGKKLETIRRNAMVIKVNEDNTLSIRPFYQGEGGLIVEQLTPPEEQEEDEVFLYDNTYEPESKRFKLYYRYRAANDEGVYSDWITMREIDELVTDLDEESEI